MGAIEDEGQAGDAWEREEVTAEDQESAISYRAPGEKAKMRRKAPEV
jgi:hypothetical protein